VEFSLKILFAKNSNDLECKFTVFMNNRVKLAQKEETQVGDISFILSN
jgi:activator of 2-hydroxyglutaryl-CoA dehydratase